MMKIFILLTVLSFAVLSHCGGGQNSNENTNNPVDPVRILFAGVGDYGIFDPSLAKDPGSNRIWMSYSEVDQSSDSPANQAINTRLAYSNNLGAHWSDSGTIVNQSTDIALPFPSPNNVGTWEHEVSSICYDPGAPVSERWKIVWHRYLCVNGSRLFQHGWIGMRTAPAPQGAWSSERKLFVGSLYDPANDPTIGPPEVRLDQLHIDLNGCLVFSEPALLATDTALYVCMLGAEGSSTNGRIILLKYLYPAGPWEYKGTFLLNSIDGPALGYDGFSAPSLFQKDGKYYLIVTPQIADQYQGAFVFEIEDLERASLKRKTGVLQSLTSISGKPGSHNGAAGYVSHSSASGILYSEVMLTMPFNFQIYGSKINP